MLRDRISAFADSTPNVDRHDRLHPVVRLLCPAMLMVGVLLTGNAPVYYAFVCALLGLAGVLGVARTYWSRFWKIGLTVGVFTLVIRGFFDYGDHVLLYVGPFTLTAEGLASANWYIAMLLAVCAPIVLVSSLLRITDLTVALERLGLSREASYIVMNSVRMIPEMGVNARAVQDAQRSRGLQVDGGRIVRLKALLPTIGPLVLGALNSVEERAVAMEVRAFGADRTPTSLRYQRELSGGAKAFLAGTAVAAATIAALGRLV